MQSTGNDFDGLPRPLAEINVTPLVDVMLVLLIIFMVSAPLLETSQGVELDLPETESVALPPPDLDPLIVSVDAKGKVFISETEVPIEGLEDKIQGILENQPGKKVFFRGDRAVPYGVAVDVMARLKRGGVTNLGMVTVPTETRK